MKAENYSFWRKQWQQKKKNESTVFLCLKSPAAAGPKMKEKTNQWAHLQNNTVWFVSFHELGYVYL